MPTTHVTTMRTTDLPGNAQWYVNNYPDRSDWVAGVDPRCWEVLDVLGPIYNALNSSHPGGGLSREHFGLALHTNTELATFDGAAMTRLVLAAHQHQCRVAVSAVDLIGTRVDDPDWYDSAWIHVFDSDDNEWHDYWDGVTRVEPVDSTVCEAATDSGKCGRLLVRLDTDHPWAHEDDALSDQEHDPEPADLVAERISGCLRILITPRDRNGTDFMSGHPDLDRLQEQARQAALDAIESHLDALVRPLLADGVADEDTVARIRNVVVSCSERTGTRPDLNLGPNNQIVVLWPVTGPDTDVETIFHLDRPTVDCMFEGNRQTSMHRLSESLTGEVARLVATAQAQATVAG